MRTLVIALLAGTAACGGALDVPAPVPPPPVDAGQPDALDDDAQGVDAGHPLCCVLEDGTGTICGCNGKTPAGPVLFTDNGGRSFWCGDQVGECDPSNACSAILDGHAHLGRTVCP